LWTTNRPSQGIELPVFVCQIAGYVLILDLGTVKSISVVGAANFE